MHKGRTTLGPFEAGKAMVSGLRRSSGPAGDGRARSARGAGAGRAGPRSRRDRKAGHSGGGELGQDGVTGGQLVVYLERFGRQLDHAPAGEEPQDAHARYLQDVRDLVGLEPGQGAKARLPVGPRDVDAIDRDRV
jgi:hypothetical protein